MNYIKRLFSFKGRIRRKEYVLTYIVLYAFLVAIAIVCFCLEAYFRTMEEQGEEISNGQVFLFFTFFVFGAAVSGWICFAQGAKRCHDRGNSGWYQLIPFYWSWMVFADGNPHANRYGLDPKGRDEEEHGLKLWEKIAIGISILLQIICSILRFIDIFSY